MLLSPMHLSLVDLYQALCHVPSLCRMKTASCGEQQILEWCLKVWRFLSAGILSGIVSGQTWTTQELS